jgi:hypothetical protein
MTILKSSFKQLLIKTLSLEIIFLSFISPNLCYARNTFYNENSKTNISTILTDEKSEICKSGYLRAFNGTWALRKWYPKKSLCYKVDTNKHVVVLKDPSKWMFNSERIAVDDFVYIPTAEETAAREDEERRANIARNIELWNKRNDPAISQPQRNDDGVRMLMLNGDLKTCIKTGPLMDCD